MENEGKKKIAKLDRLKSLRGTFDTLWQDIADYTLPSREIIMQNPVPGRKKNGIPYDATAVWANEQLAAGLHGMLTGSSQKWFALKFDDPTYDGEEGKLWINNVERIMINVFNSPQSLFNSQAHEMYLELCAFGTGVLYEEMDSSRVIRFKAYPIVDCYIDEDEMGRVNTMFRITKTSAGNAVRYFGDNVSKKIKEINDKDPFAEVKVLHVVEPNDKGVKGSYSTNKPFKSCWVCMQDQKIMSEGGYDMFPYQVPRFSKRTNEKYGYGPGAMAHPDVRQINRMMEVSIRGGEKMVDPPLLVPDDGVIEPLTLQPGGLNYYRANSEGIKPLLTNARPDFAYQLMDMIRQSIVRHFYVDWLNLPQQPNMTATEVLQRRDERLRLLSPMLSRLQTELLGPLIDRVFMLLANANMIPEAPEEIAGRSIRVEYTSPLAQAQRGQELESLLRSLSVATNLAAFDPQVMENYDFDAIARYSAIDVNNVPAKLLKTRRDVLAAREANGQAQQAMQEAQLAVEQTKAAKQAANAQKFITQAQ